LARRRHYRRGRALVENFEEYSGVTVTLSSIP
jgi:hypothetical protein